VTNCRKSAETPAQSPPKNDLTFDAQGVRHTQLFGVIPDRLLKAH
jgi:hypothetical protein